MLIREIEHGGQEYRGTLAMRHGILRAPLGLDWSADDLAGEDGQLHFGLFDDDGVLVGCVVVKPLSDGTAKIRQMAVADGGRGNGRRLVETQYSIEAQGPRVAQFIEKSLQPAVADK